MADSGKPLDSVAPLVHLFWGMACLFFLVAGILVGRGILAPESVIPADDETAYPFPVNVTSITARCSKVLDGDTIEVTWESRSARVRMLGVDCPETKNNKKLREQADLLGLSTEAVLEYGEIAKKTTESWVLNRDVSLVFFGGEIQRDSFGRLLSYVEQEGTDIGRKLLTGGNAFNRDSPHPRREEYMVFEAEAKKEMRGIWRLKK